MLLTSDEKKKFIEWLDMEQLSNNALLGIGRGFLPPAIEKMLSDEAKAVKIVADKLRSMESQTIGKEE